MTLLNNTVTFDFIRPWWLCLLIPVIPAIWIYILKQNTLPKCWKDVLSADATGRYSYNGLSIRQRIKQTCCPLLFLLLCIVILAGPSWKQGEKTVTSAPVVIAVDASNAFDFIKIKSLTYNIIEHLVPSPSALIAYSGSAHIVSSFTEDKKTLHYLVEALSPEIMPVKGNYPKEAIAQALNLLKAGGFKAGKIILITDEPVNVQKIQINKMLSGKKISTAYSRYHKKCYYATPAYRTELYDNNI